MKQALLGRRALFAVLGVLILVGAYWGIRSVVTTIKLPGAENGSPVSLAPRFPKPQNAPGIGATPTLPLELVPERWPFTHLARSKPCDRVVDGN
jgi:hypothetical protein